MPEDIKWIDGVLFAPRIAAGFRVARPFEVKISQESLEDLRLTLAELFVGLEERQTSLSADLEEVRERLSSHLEPITA